MHFVPKLPTVTETADLLILHIVHLHGIPQDVMTVRGPQFSSQVWKVFCLALGASASLSSGYHPQTNGQTERVNQDLGAALRCVASRHPSAWSPLHVFLGYQPPLFPEHEMKVAVPDVQVNMRRLRRVWRLARAALLRTSARTKRMADKHLRPCPNIRSNSSGSKDIPLRFQTRKLAPRFIGPYEIERVVSPSAVRLK